MTNPINATLTADDTQEFTIPTRPIINADFIHGYNALNGHLVIYQHFSDSHKKYYGRIYSVFPEKFGLAVYVKPVDGQGVSIIKPFHVSEIALVEA